MLIRFLDCSVFLIGVCDSFAVVGIFVNRSGYRQMGTSKPQFIFIQVLLEITAVFRLNSLSGFLDCFWLSRSVEVVHVCRSQVLYFFFLSKSHHFQLPNIRYKWTELFYLWGECKNRNKSICLRVIFFVGMNNSISE